MESSNIIKNKILQLTVDYYKAKENENEKEKSNKIQYAGRVYNERELLNLVDSSLEFQLTSGIYIDEFEKKFAEYNNSKYCVLVNSGSSANLLAFHSLTSSLLGDRRIKRGDEIITLAAGFPTTVTPIVQYGAVPVFVDIDINTLNIDTNYLKLALSKKTKAIMIAHTLGNPYEIEEIRNFCDMNNLFLISDECDALGSKYNGKELSYYSDISTHSFFPAHILCMGQGGAVCTNDYQLYKILKSMRSWGRDFKCKTCVNFCKKRYKDNSIDDYDCRYSFSNLGFNLQSTEMQASIGVAQLEKVDDFKKKRKENFNRIYSNLEDLQNYLILPKKLGKSDPVWFAFWITLNKDVNFKRLDLIKYLDKNNIDTRMFFAGNIIKQECFNHLEKDVDYRIIGDLKYTDYVADNTFFIGVYPGLTLDNIDFMCDKIREFIYLSK